MTFLFFPVLVLFVFVVTPSDASNDGSPKQNRHLLEVPKTHGCRISHEFARRLSSTFGRTDEHDDSIHEHSLVDIELSDTEAIEGRSGSDEDDDKLRFDEDELNYPVEFPIPEEEIVEIDVREVTDRHHCGLGYVTISIVAAISTIFIGSLLALFLTLILRAI